MHAEIRYSDEVGSYVIKDHASQHGTFINGARICQVGASSPGWGCFIHSFLFLAN